MTEPHDELASAWLDGELADDELDAAASDHDVRQARDALAAVRDQLAEPVIAPAGLADRQIARALQALPVPAGGGDGRERATVTALRTATARQARRGGAGPQWLSRAAVVVLLAGGVGVGVAALAGREDRADRDESALVSSTAGSRSALGATGGSGTGGEAEESGATGTAEAGDVDDGTRLGALEPQAEAGADASAQPPAARPETVSEAAIALLAVADLDAVQLRQELEARFGPADGWPGNPAEPARCAGPGLAAVPLVRHGQPLELVVPVGGDPFYADPGSCQPVS